MNDLALDARTGLWLPSALAEPRRCRFCHCTDAAPCIDDHGRQCGWAEPDLCSACDTEFEFSAVTCLHGFVRPCAVCDGTGQVPDGPGGEA